MIGRRSFLAGILAAGAAPAIVKAESLMKIVVPSHRVLWRDKFGELGQIDGFRIVTSEMMRGIKSPLHLIGRSRPMPNPNLQSLRFRRYAGGPLLVPRDISIDLINNRKTA